MKKIMAFLVASLFSTAVAGCSSANLSNTDSKPSDGANSAETTDTGVTQVDFWHFFSGGDGETMAKMIEEFNASQSDYKVVGITQDWGTFYTKLQTSVLAGEGPDLSSSHHQYVWTLANKGIIEPLDVASNNAGIEIAFENFDPVIEQEKYEDSYYSAPIDLLPVVMFYNKDMCEEAGLLDEKGDLIDYGTGIDNFVALMEKASNAQAGKLALTVPTTGAEPMMIFDSIYYQLGGEGQLIADDRLTWNMDEKTGIKAFELYDKIYEQSLKDVQNCNEVFVNGQTTFFIGGVWELNTIRKGLGDDNVGITTMPIVGEKAAFESGGHALVLPVNDARTDEETKGAMEFIKWFTSHTDQWGEAGGMPAYVPSRETELFQSYPFHKYYENVFEHQSPLTFTAPFNMSGGVAECIEPLSKLVNDEVDAEGAYLEMKERMEAACAGAQ